MTQHFFVFEDIRRLQNPWNSFHLSSVHCAVVHSNIEGHMVNIAYAIKRYYRNRRGKAIGWCVEFVRLGLTLRLHPLFTRNFTGNLM
jgi:hypothetical protein